jgi:hypothetical protein
MVSEQRTVKGVERNSRVSMLRCSSGICCRGQGTWRLPEGNQSLGRYMNPGVTNAKQRPAMFCSVHDVKYCWNNDAKGNKISIFERKLIVYIPLWHLVLCSRNFHENTRGRTHWLWRHFPSFVVACSFIAVINHCLLFSLPGFPYLLSVVRTTVKGEVFVRICNSLKPNGNHIYRLLQQSITLVLCLCVSYDSQYKQRLFP